MAAGTTAAPGFEQALARVGQEAHHAFAYPKVPERLCYEHVAGSSG